MKKRELLQVKQLSKDFQKKSSLGFQTTSISAVKNVSFSIREGELFALIGESGSGKTTLAKLLLRMEQPTSGQIKFLGQLDQPNTKRSPAEMQVIFQNPDSAMNPFLTVLEQVKEPLIVSGISEPEKKAVEMLNKVGIGADLLDRLPQKLSGGQKQRVVIARALVTNPRFVIADEPVSSLDVTLQSQVIQLMMQLKDALDLTYFFISHDLRLVAEIADRVAVMYQGEIVEMGETMKVLNEPQHTYTKALIESELVGIRG